MDLSKELLQQVESIATLKTLTIPIGIAAVLIAAWITNILVSKSVTRFEATLKLRQPTKSIQEAEKAARIETGLRVGLDIFKFSVWVFAVMTALSHAGVSVQPLVAGAGLLGAAVAFGSQAIVKDFVAGFFILLEGHFELNDVITIGTQTGIVEKMTLRVTVLRDSDGTVYVIPNGTIATVANKTVEWSAAVVSFIIPFAVDLEKSRATLQKIAEIVAKKEGAEKMLLQESLEVRGPIAWKEKGIEWAIAARCRPDATDIATLRAWIIETASAQFKKDEIPFALLD